MKTRKKSRGFTKQIISLCKSASLLVTAAALTVSMGHSLTLPDKAFAADSSGSAAAAVQSDIVPLKTQAYDWGRVKIVGGGFIPGIIFNEKEKDLIYARTDMGGAYRWDPATKTWIQLLEWVSLEDWNLSGVESLATDPVDPNRVYIAAGTYSNDWVQSNGYILRSQDRGQTWEKTEMPFKFGGNMPGRSMGERLAVDPNDNRILYLGARNGNGLWMSEDYGATWHKVSSFTPVGDVKDDYGGNVGPVWVTFDPSTGSAGHATQTIYVGLADTQTSIYKSVDGGATWEPVAGQPKQGYLPHHGTLGSNGMLYVSYNSTIGPYNGGNGAIWKLDTKTGEWTDISPGGAGNTSNPYGGLAVDAQHPDTLMVATMNNWWPEESIYRSTDGGKTWKSLWEFSSYPKRDNRYTIDYSISPWLDWGVQRDPETDPQTSPKLGWMIGDLEIDPFNSDRIMYGTGATLFGSEDMTDLDRGEKIQLSVMANGIEETAILGLISPPSGAPLISAMGDIGGFRHEDLNTAPEMITNPYIGTSNDLDYAETNPNLIVRVGHASKQDARMGVSTDNGVTWTPAANAWQAENGDDTGGGWVAVGANGHTIVWAPEGNAVRPVSFSTDLGKTWTASIGIPQGSVVSSDRINPDKFYGFHDGKFYVSTDGGANFTASAASGLPNNLNGKIKAAPTAEGDVWLASEEGLFRSTDSGASFKKVGGIDEAVSVGFGKEAPGKTYKTIYAGMRVNGGKFGFYRSEDEGASWIRMNDDQHQFANARGTITGDGQVYGRVYIGTNGMGIVRGDMKQGATVQGFHVNDLTVEAGSSAALAPVFDGGASSRPIVWSSSDASVASVSGDQVTGLKPGKAAITAVSADGQYAATAVVTVTSAMPMREITTMELVKEMGIGINLGNTFESTGDWINNTSVTNYETAWGSPVITEEMIKGYASEGFGVLRIPVSWSNMMGEDYTIHPDYLARVKEVVDWAMDSGMYVILNIHWDGGWFEKFPTEKEESMYKYTRIWTQLSNAFKNYNDYLMLESFNEEGNWLNLWNYYAGTNGKEEAYALLNEINQTFVDIVRGSGGNNERRHLLIGGYITDIEKTVDELYKLPNDPQNRSAVSIHYYTPPTFAILEEDASWGKARTEWGTDEDYAELNKLMDMVKTRFIDKGIPVIMGEFGVATKNKTQDMIRLYLTSVAKAAYSRGITPVLWDITNVFYNRDNAEMNDKVLLEQLMAVKRPTVQTPMQSYVNAMQPGYNLGNSLDARGPDETSWGNPVVTQAFIQQIADQGFKSIRIPVTWYQHTGPAPSYTVDPAWMSRVQQIVDWSLDAGLYVMINMHHDSAEWVNTMDTNHDQVVAEYTAVWTQIANTFKNYSNKLMFESINEPVFGNNLADTTQMSLLNELNTTFFNIVRTSGGNNGVRPLVLPSLWTNASQKYVDSLAATIETLNDANIIATVHYYGLWHFSVNIAGYTTFNAEAKNDIDTMVNNVYHTFVSKGIPVVVGEYGILGYGKGEETVERGEMLKYFEYFLNATQSKSIATMMWDYGPYVNRTTFEWSDPELYHIIMHSLTGRTSTTSFDRIFIKSGETVSDQSVTLNLNGNSFVSLKNGDQTLVAGTDYTVNGDVLTLKASYLSSLATGALGEKAVLSAHFSAGPAWKLYVNYYDTATLSSVSGTITPQGFDIPAAFNGDRIATMEAKYADGGNAGPQNWTSYKEIYDAYSPDYANGRIRLTSRFFSETNDGVVHLTFHFWSGKVVTYTITKDGTTVTGTGSGNSAPSVSITSYQDGQAINLNSPQLDWTFHDADDADVQAAYQVQASSNGWETVDVDSGELAGASGSYILNGLADGNWSIRVRLKDNGGAWSEWAYRSLIIDTAAPTMNVVLDKETLWPANNKLVNVTAIVETGDELSQVELLSITPSVAVDRYESMVQEADFGTFDTEFKLLAKKAMGKEPLVYTITYRAIDQAGNVTEASATVTVPHDQGKK